MLEILLSWHSSGWIIIDFCFQWSYWLALLCVMCFSFLLKVGYLTLLTWKLNSPASVGFPVFFLFYVMGVCVCFEFCWLSVLEITLRWKPIIFWGLFWVCDFPCEFLLLKILQYMWLLLNVLVLKSWLSKGAKGKLKAWKFISPSNVLEDPSSRDEITVNGERGLKLWQIISVCLYLHAWSAAEISDQNMASKHLSQFYEGHIYFFKFSNIF